MSATNELEMMKYFIDNGEMEYATKMFNLIQKNEDSTVSVKNVPMGTKTSNSQKRAQQKYYKGYKKRLKRRRETLEAVAKPIEQSTNPESTIRLHKYLNKACNAEIFKMTDEVINHFVASNCLYYKMERNAKVLYLDTNRYRIFNQ